MQRLVIILLVSVVFIASCRSKRETGGDQPSAETVELSELTAEETDQKAAATYCQYKITAIAAAPCGNFSVNDLICVGCNNNACPSIAGQVLAAGCVITIQSSNTNCATCPPGLRKFNVR